MNGLNTGSDAGGCGVSVLCACPTRKYCSRSVWTGHYLISCVTWSAMSRHSRLCVPVSLKDLPRARAPYAYWSLVARETNASVRAAMKTLASQHDACRHLLRLRTSVRHCRPPESTRTEAKSEDAAAVLTQRLLSFSHVISAESI